MDGRQCTMTQGICSGCGRCQILTHARWQRKPAPTCKHCEKKLVRAAETRPGEFGPRRHAGKPRRCRGCDAKLSSYNFGEVCFPCSKKSMADVQEKGGAE